SQEGRTKRVKRLSNSVRIEPSHFPYMIFIEYFEKPHCAGALVDEQYFIAAAHCFCHGGGEAVSNLKNFTVVAGSRNLADTNSGIRTGVKKVGCHPNFDHSPEWEWVINDIAVIRVKEPFKLSDSIKPIKLPAPHQEYPAGTQFVVTGYGSTVFNGPHSNYLRVSLKNSISQEQCKKLMPDSYQGLTTLCTKSGHGSGVCDYDNGSPLIKVTETEKIIVGVVSTGNLYSCGESPDIYTKVSQYIDFIRAQMLFV
ncbi:hypothetical protein QAD02_010158, partial [Eretmocerus hayati]